MKPSSRLLLILVFSSVQLLSRVQTAPVLGSEYLLGGIKNVTLSATSFLTNSLQKPKDMIMQVTDTASEYVSKAVAAPAAILTQAKDATRNYIDSTASRGMEIKFRSIMEGMRTQMPYGIQALDLPPLEPLRVSHYEMNASSPEIGHLTSCLDNVTVSLLSTFEIDHAKISLVDGLNIAVNVSVPKIKADGLYRITGIFGTMFGVNGNGPFELEVQGVRAYVHVVLGYSGTMYVKYMDIDYSVESLQAFFHHLYEDPEADEIMNRVISKSAPDIIELTKPSLKPIFKDMLARKANVTVSNLTMGRILSILTGSGDSNSLNIEI